MKNKYKKATFAGGCFWCSDADFEKRKGRDRGVIEVISGYSGGDEKSPSYKQVASGKTGHREAVQVIYDPKKISYSELLDIFWRHIDPTDNNGQFADKGKQYTTAIFYHDEKQKKLAEKSKRELEKSVKYNIPIVTEIIKFKKFYPAEDYHQNYYKKCPIEYKVYRKGSGRDFYLNKIWDKK